MQIQYSFINIIAEAPELNEIRMPLTITSFKPATVLWGLDMKSLRHCTNLI